MTAFNGATDYDWVLPMQETGEDEQTGGGCESQLKGVCEPLRMQERM